MLTPFTNVLADKFVVRVDSTLTLLKRALRPVRPLHVTDLGLKTKKLAEKTQKQLKTYLNVDSCKVITAS